MLKSGCAFGFVLTLLCSQVTVLAQGLAQETPGLVGGTPAGPQAAMSMSNSNRLSYTNPFGMVPKFSPDFWTNASGNRLGAGTILTGILDDPISSKKSKAGDLFTIRLQDGFVVNGKAVIPQQSKIIGSVVNATSSKGLRNGEPGQVNISLQTLVFPDGRHIVFYGNMDHNPAQDMKSKNGNSAVGIANTGKRTVNSVVSMVTGRVGFRINPHQSGDELVIPAGIAVPIRVSRPIDLTQMEGVPQTAQVPPAPAPGGMQQDPPSIMQPAGPAVSAAPPISAGPPQQGMAAPAAMSLNDVPTDPALTPHFGSGPATMQMADPF